METLELEHEGIEGSNDEAKDDAKEERRFRVGGAEVAVGVVVVGILGLLGVVTVRQSIAHTRVTEARDAMTTIAKDASRALEAHGDAGATMSAGTSSGGRRLCGASTSVPADANAIRGAAYQSSEQDWDQGNADNGWRCLRFRMTAPQHFLYRYVAPGGAPLSGTHVHVDALGELRDGTVLTRFRLRGEVQPNGQLVWASEETEVAAEADDMVASTP